jgi:ABC-type sulfate/molybdate transport systems ATPase subunit
MSAGRKVLTERIGGQILINGVPKSQETFGRIMGYVDKIEAYTPYMTVRETVAYSATLRLGRSCPKERRERYVEEVIECIYTSLIAISIMFLFGFLFFWWCDDFEIQFNQCSTI